MNPLMRFALPHAEQASLDDLERVRFQVDQDKQQPVFGCPQGAVLIDGKSACGARFPIEASRCQPCLERRLKGRDQLLKLVERQAGEIQELCGARLQIGEPQTNHGSYLLSLSRDVRGASYQKESGINSIPLDEFRLSPPAWTVAQAAWGAGRGNYSGPGRVPLRCPAASHCAPLPVMALSPGCGTHPPQVSCTLTR